MRCARGQATIDYIALVAVLAIVLGAGLAFATLGAPGIVNAVAGQLRYALCIVGGGPCADPRPRPCAVATMRDARHVAVNLVLVRADEDRYVLRELMSDGTVRLTVASSAGAGVEVGLGGGLKVALKDRRLGVSNGLRAGAQGVLGSGQVFVARDEREADALLRAIRAAGRPQAPPAEVFVEGGVRALGRVGIGRSLSGASLDGLLGAVIGARRDRRSGATTLTLASTGSGWGAVTAALGGPLGGAGHATTLALTLDREHRPRELSLSTSGTLAAGATLPPGLAGTRASARLPSTRSAGRRWELAARLDLLDPAVAATWARFRGDPTSGDAIRALGRAMRERAHVDVRTYQIDSDADGVSAGLGLGLHVGGEFEHTIDRGRLLAASTRPPGGLWEPRLDCVRA